MNTKLECGKLRHRIYIMAPSGVQDSFGGVASDSQAAWTKVLSCWAAIDSPTARDAAAAGSYVSTVTHKVTIRYPRSAGTVDTSMQVWFSGRTFIIQGITNPDETTKMLFLWCTEIANPNNPATPDAAETQ